MEGVFIVLTLVSLVCFLLSWLMPNTFSPLFDDKLSKGKIRLVFGLSIIIFFVAFGISSDGNHPVSENKKASEQTADVKQVSSGEQVKTKEPKLEDAQQLVRVDTQILTTFDTQDIFDGKQKTVVWIQNNSEDIFKGSLFVTVKSKIDGSHLGSDTVFVDSLLPGQKTYSILKTKPSSAMEYEHKWSSVSFKASSSTSTNQAENAPYKLLKEKKESGGTVIPKIEFYLATDKDFDKMYAFLKSKQIDKGILYHAVFVDDEKYATFSKYPITAMYFEDIQSKHIVATYWYNTQNGNREFSSYEKNSYESVAQTRKD